MMKIHIENIGPFEKADLNDNCNKSCLIFARNGSGKTYLSRCFNVFSSDEKELNTIPEILLRNDKAKALFTYENNEGSISFSIENNIITKDVKMDKNFYVYNSDYIEKNLYVRNYQPNGEIDGVVIGKKNIDLTKEKEELKKLEENRDDIQKEIEKQINILKDEIKKLGVSSSLNDFKDITFDNILNKGYVDSHIYEKAKNDLKSVLSAPDNFKQIKNIVFDFNVDVFQLIKDVLTTEYNVEVFEEQFSHFVKNNLDFIEKGIDLLDEKNKCPFCGSDLKDDNKALIHKYTLFIKDEQTKVIKQIQSFYNELNDKLFYLERYKSEINKCYNEIEAFSFFIPNIVNIDLGKAINEVDSLKEELILIFPLLEKKKNDISINCWDNIINVDNLTNIVFQTSSEINKLVDSINSQYSRISSIKTEAKRKLCGELMKKISIDNFDRFRKYRHTIELINEKKKEIIGKESGALEYKKDLIAANMEKYLKEIFGDKYIFDKNNFEIMLGKNQIGDKAKFILSDGEKSIFAFIHYLANVHSIVAQKDDYDKILFVIDDPVSSMDYYYIYNVIYIIKYLHKELNINHRCNYILLTHNLEFYHSLIRSRIFNDNPNILINNTLTKCKKELIMPYELHLYDIVKACEKKEVNHTIPNSIRHVIETICQFEGKSTSVNDLLEFVESSSELKDNPGIISIINDLSHGNVRFEKTYIEEQVLGACQALVNYINANYPYQIENVEDLMSSSFSHVQ